MRLFILGAAGLALVAGASAPALSKAHLKPADAADRGQDRASVSAQNVDARGFTQELCTSGLVNVSAEQLNECDGIKGANSTPTSDDRQKPSQSTSNRR